MLNRFHLQVLEDKSEHADTVEMKQAVLEISHTLGIVNVLNPISFNR